MMRCKYLDGMTYQGKEIEIWCAHPDLLAGKENWECPFKDEIECELLAHKINLQ